MNVLIRIYKRVLPNWIEHIGRELANCDSLLDLGCGDNSVVCRYGIPYTVGVDLYEPYLHKSATQGLHGNYVLADITSLELRPKSFDAVLASEVLEHIGKDVGYELLENMERWARCKVVVKVPNGYVVQDAFNGNPYQEHRSAWFLHDLEALGYKTTGMSGWRPLRGSEGKVKIWPYFIGDRISDLTQPLVYHKPQHAFQLLGVKSLV